MMTTPSVLSSCARWTALFLASHLLCLQARAEDETENQPVEATFNFGVNASSGDRGVYGQYNGFGSDRNVLGLLSLDYHLRKPETFTWVDFSVDDLLGDMREMHLVWKHPGEWKATADYSELVRHDPYTITANNGIDSELKTRRTGLGLGFSKIIDSAFQLDVDLKSENKEGSRLFGIGMNCPTGIAPCGTANTNSNQLGWAVLMLPEPIHANHSQIEARLSYAREKLNLHVGYYGSIYRNDHSTLNPSVPGSLNNPLGSLLALGPGLQALLNQPVALAPDNQANHFDVSGNYAFTPSTHGTFKLGYSNASQNDSFASAGLTGAPAGITNLGASVDTTLVRLGLTSRPIDRLSLLADWRYEYKDDHTPIAYYSYASPTVFYTNRRLPYRKDSGKLQASWQLPGAYKVTLASDYEAIDRGTFTQSSVIDGTSALRQKTEENGVRGELRRQMSADFSGSVSLASSKRTGSNWLRDNGTGGVSEVANSATGFLPSAIFTPMLADRKRDKLRLLGEWQPNKKLTVQFSAEEGKDHFDSPSVYGLRDSRMSQFGIDWVYAESFNWNFNGYLAQSIQTFNQSRYAGYVMAIENTNINVGIGFTGRLSSVVEIGGNLMYSDDKSVHAQKLDAYVGADSMALLAATGGLPDVVYRQTALKLYGKYALDKHSDVRLDLVQHRTSVDDWTWGYNGVPFTYSDGSTVVQKPSQTVSVIGLTYSYRFH